MDSSLLLLGPWDSPGKNTRVGCQLQVSYTIPNPSQEEK